MDHTASSGSEFNERAELKYSDNVAFEYIVDLGIFCDSENDTLRFICLFAIRRSYEYGTVVADIDLNAGVFDYLIDNFTA